MSESEHRPPTLKSLYESTLRRHADAPAITFDGETLTYADLDARSARAAAAFRERGLETSDHVGVLVSNRPAYTVTDIGLARAGLVKVPLNDMLSAADIEYMLANGDASAVVVGPNFVDTIETVAPSVPTLEHVFTVDADAPASLAERYRTARFGRLLDEAAPEPPAVSVGRGTLAGIFHTGGTTGDPKGVKHTQETLALNALAHAIELDIRPRETLLLMTPLPHSAGLIMAGGLTQGCRHVVTQGFDARHALETIEREAVSWTFMVPTMIYRVLDELDEGSYDTATLETLVYGAAPMKPARLRDGLDRLGNVFVQLYGQYETPDLITVLPKHAHDPADEERLSSCGLPTSMCKVMIVDDDGDPVPPGDAGEILARGAYSMTGYYEMPERTAETVADGWIHTGDIGRMDEDGYVYILDRDSDVIITGVMNVYSVTVEDVIQQHEQVANVAVIGVPDDDWGEAVRAVVVPEGDTVDRAALLSFCADRLADYETPKSVDVVDSLPTTPYGKLDKKRLREPYWSTATREIS